MTKFDDLSQLTLDEIDILFGQLDEIKTHSKTMSEKLQGMAEMVSGEDYIDTGKLKDIMETVQLQLQMQEDFRQKFQQMGLDFSDGNLAQVEKMLQDTKNQLTVNELSMMALKEFQLAGIEHEETGSLLEECKKKALGMRKFMLVRN